MKKFKDWLNEKDEPCRKPAGMTEKNCECECKPCMESDCKNCDCKNCKCVGCTCKKMGEDKESLFKRVEVKK